MPRWWILQESRRRAACAMYRGSERMRWEAQRCRADRRTRKREQKTSSVVRQGEVPISQGMGEEGKLSDLPCGACVAPLCGWRDTSKDENSCLT